MEEKVILDGLIASIREILSDERLGSFNNRERSVMGRLSRCMGSYYDGWDIDTDYEKIGDDPKYLDILPNGEPGQKPIQPDIIVHQMGKPDNLLVVEIKLHDNKNIALDLWKLAHMTRKDGMYAYRVGVHVILNLQEQSVVQSLIFVGGATHPDLTQWFHGHFA